MPTTVMLATDEEIREKVLYRGLNERYQDSFYEVCMHGNGVLQTLAQWEVLVELSIERDFDEPIYDVSASRRNSIASACRKQAGPILKKVQTDYKKLRTDALRNLAVRGRSKTKAGYVAKGVRLLLLDEEVFLETLSYYQDKGIASEFDDVIDEVMESVPWELGFGAVSFDDDKSQILMREAVNKEFFNQVKNFSIAFDKMKYAYMDKDAPEFI